MEPSSHGTQRLGPFLSTQYGQQSIGRLCHTHMRDIYRRCKVTANPAKTRLGLKEVEYVGHLISSTGTSFTEEKRLQVLDFPLPETEKAFLPCPEYD